MRVSLRCSAGRAFRILSILFVWAFAHHLLAGVRHLLSDIDIGSRLSAARTSAFYLAGMGLWVLRILLLAR